MKTGRIDIRQIPGVAKRIVITPMKKLPVPSLDLSSFTVGGPSDRTMRTEREYRKYRRTSTFANCVFCQCDENELIREADFFRVIRTKFKYEVWDDRMVDEHYLLVTKRHIKNVSEFTHDEREEFLSLWAEYENDGFSLYSRAPGDAARSVEHFHSHLLKLQRQTIHSMIYVNKPHIMLYRKRRNSSP